MSLTLNPITGKLDVVQSINTLDDCYVNVDGDTMTGDLGFPVLGFIMIDSVTLTRYRITLINGSLKATPIAVTPMGSPWLFLFGNI